MYSIQKRAYTNAAACGMLRSFIFYYFSINRLRDLSHFEQIHVGDDISRVHKLHQIALDFPSTKVVSLET